MTSYFNVFNKKRKLVVTSEQIIVCDAKNNEIKRRNQHKDLEGVTKSLLLDSHNFLIHFKRSEVQEYICEYREQVIELIYQIYFLKFCKKGKGEEEEIPRLKIFGVSSPKLQEYCTTEKDLIRQINRMPNDEFLLDVTGDGHIKAQADKASLMGADDIEGLDQEIDDFFDFVIIDDDMINNKDKKVQKVN